MKEYLTVQEFAKQANISAQAVYKAVKGGRLAKYSRKSNGRLEIRSEALGLYIVETVIDGQGEREQEGFKHESTDKGGVFKEEIAFLKEQIQQKDKQIADLSEMLKTSQKLYMIEHQKLLEIEQKTEEPEQEEKTPEVEKFTTKVDEKLNPVETPKNSGIKGFFRRLFN